MNWLIPRAHIACRAYMVGVRLVLMITHGAVDWTDVSDLGFECDGLVGGVTIVESCCEIWKSRFEYV
jgi:hypothetical protein